MSRLNGKPFWGYINTLSAENILFGTVTFMSLIITISAVQRAFNQIFDLFIGSRFHSIIASTSMLVPTIAIGWGPKYFEIMQTLGQEKYVIDHKSLSLDPLVDIVSFAWNQRILIKRDLKDKIELMKKSATENVKLVARMISNE